jgi:hypothetical protein
MAAERLLTFDRKQRRGRPPPRSAPFSTKDFIPRKTPEMTAVSIATRTEPQELDMLASQIRAGVSTVSSHMRGLLSTALDVGEWLIEAQKQVPKGKWECWVEHNCALSLRSAQGYMRIARKRDVIEAHQAEAPDLSLRAALQLAAAEPSTDTASSQAQRVAPRHGPGTPNILEHWERSSEFEQRAVLAAMKRDKLLAILRAVLATMPREQLLTILPDGIGVVPASVKPKNGFAALPPLDGDDGLGIPDFLRRPLIIATH